MNAPPSTPLRLRRARLRAPLVLAAALACAACSVRHPVARTRCEPGSTETAWAAACPTEPAPCEPGTWVAAGSPDAGDQLIVESAHFAVYSDGPLAPSQAQAAADFLEGTVWRTYFGPPVLLREPYCGIPRKLKTSVLVRSSHGLEAGTWQTGGDVVMVLRVSPRGLGDRWGLAHLLAGANAMRAGGLSCPGADTCSWIFSSLANWLAHQLPEFASDVHCSEMLANVPHLYLGSSRDRYCNWQVLEYLKDRHCFAAATAAWEGGTPGPDPFGRIAAARGWSTSDLNDFLGEWALHNVTWDYRNPAPGPASDLDPGATFRAAYGPLTRRDRPERRLRLTALEPLDDRALETRRFASPWFWAPQRWGYDVVQLFPDPGADAVGVTFRGVVQDGQDSDWRWGLVATDDGLTRARYGALQRGARGSASLCVSPGERVFLVVMATPTVPKAIVAEQAYPTIPRYPWLVELDRAWPEGFRGGAPEPCPSGLVRHPNGGGCAPPDLEPAVYVGPHALVAGGAVSGGARVEGHAAVLSGTVSGGVVGALATVSGLSLTGGASALTTFYPLGAFEAGQSLSGTALLYGDVELRGAGLALSSGAYCGFVDGTTAPQTIADVTVPPPYAWPR